MSIYKLPALTVLQVALCLPCLASTTLATESADQRDYLFLLDDKDRSQARDAALGYLARVDTATGSYGVLERLFKDSPCLAEHGASESVFVREVSEARAGKGLPNRRVLEAVNGGFRWLPSSKRASQYAIAAFDVTYTGSDLWLTEQVTLERGAAGVWSFCGYYLGPKPFYKYRTQP
jgi:hypothetical protein